MSYNGYVATVPLGLGGFTGEQNVDNIAPTELIEASNVRFDGNLIRKVGGLTRIDANVVASGNVCLAGIDWWPTTTTQRQVTVWDTGKIYKEVGGDMDSVTLATGLTITEPVTLVPCGQEIPGNDRKLLFFSKGIAPRLLSADGSSMSALSNVSVDWSSTNQPSSALVHDRRVAAYGNPLAPHAVYFSALDDHSNFAYTDANNSSSFPLPVFDIAPGEGEYITSCYSIGTTRLFVFKYPFGIYFIDTDNITSLYAPVTTVRKDIGCPSPTGICKVGELGTWFIGQDGHVYSLDMLSDPNAEIKNTCITRSKRLTQWIKDNVLPSRLKYASMIYDTNRGEVRVSYTSLTGSSNDKMLVFDVNDPQNVKISTDNRGAYYNATWPAKVSSTYFEMYTAGSGGYVYKDNQVTRAINLTTAYTGSYRTPDTDFKWLDAKLAQIDKRYDFLEFKIQNTGNYNLSVDLYIDGQYYNTFAFNLGSGGSTLDNVLYGLTPNTVKQDFILDSQGFLRKKIKIGGFGRTFSARVSNAGASEDFATATMLVYFQTLGSGGEV